MYYFSINIANLTMKKLKYYSRTVLYTFRNRLTKIKYLEFIETKWNFIYINGLHVGNTYIKLEEQFAQLLRRQHHCWQYMCTALHETCLHCLLCSRVDFDRILCPPVEDHSVNTKKA